MHPSILEWVRARLLAHQITPGVVLEVGSMDVNESVRTVFPDSCGYIGIDFREGPRVDRVMNAHALEFFDSSFDVVISTEMIEHDDEFWISIREMGRVLRSNGWLILTARGNGFMPHGYPDDFWRFTPSAFPKLLLMAGCEVIEVCEDWQPGHPGLFGLGRKL